MKTMLQACGSGHSSSAAASVTDFTVPVSGATFPRDDYLFLTTPSRDHPNMQTQTPVAQATAVSVTVPVGASIFLKFCTFLDSARMKSAKSRDCCSSTASLAAAIAALPCTVFCPALTADNPGSQ